MKRDQEVVSYFTPVEPGSQWAKYSPAPTVVGGNEPLPPKLWLAALGMYLTALLVWVACGFVLVYQGANPTLVTVVWMVAGGWATLKGFSAWMDYGSGDKAVREESRHRLRAHTHAVAAEERVQKMRIEKEAEEGARQHEFRMAQLAHEKYVLEDLRDARRTEYALAVGKSADELPLDRPDNFVAARPDPMVPEVCKWVMSLYDVSGAPRSDLFYKNGWMKAARPWNTVWATEPWGTEAQVLLEKYVLIPEGTGHRLAEGYADSRVASVNLAELRGK